MKITTHGQTMDIHVAFDLALTDFDKLAMDIANQKLTEFSPPFSDYYRKDEDIFSFYDNFFSKYLNLLRSFDSTLINEANKHLHDFYYSQPNGAVDVTFNILEETEKVCHMILDSTVQYFKGFPNEAYEIMDKCFTDKNCHLLNLLPQKFLNDQILYRVRGQKNLTNPIEIFHTPFELRNKCATYRYSIPGVPALYLGGSLETALRETNIVIDKQKRSNNKYSCIAYKSSRKKNNLLFIDLTLPEKYQMAFYERYSLILFYPLIVACGLQVKDKKSPFKPEYIIPQTFFQMLRLHTNRFDGIAYSSTKYNPMKFSSEYYKNYVLYVCQSDQEKGYSKELAEKLLCTEPISPKHGEKTFNVELRCKEQEFKEIIVPAI